MFIALLILSQMLTGAAVLACFRPQALHSMARIEKAAFALLAGLSVQSFVSLLLLFAGLTLNGWWIFLITAAALVLPAWKRQTWNSLTAANSEAGRIDSPVVRGFLFAGCALLASWVILAGYFLPTMDYDGLAIWSYRVKVLVNERTLLTESLRDPERLIAQPLHPYLIPVMESLFCIAKGSFSYRATHFPQMLVYLSFIGLALSAAMEHRSAYRRWGLAAALLLTPMLPVSFSMLSSREAIMATFGLASLLALSRWESTRRIEFMILGAWFALMMQQSKIEGLPFALGWVLGAVIIEFAGRDGQPLKTLRQLTPALAVFLLAIPWMIFRSGIPPAHMDPVLQDYRAILGLNPGHLATVLQLFGAEFLFRPELYGFAFIAIFAAVGTGWARQNLLARAGMLSAPLACLAAILLVYTLRQAELPPERNASIPRRVLVFLPALTFAAFWLPRRGFPERY